MRGSVRARTQRKTTMLVGSAAILTLVLGLLLLLKPAAPPRPEALLREALNSLEKQERYDLIIQEQAPGYTLLFTGEVDREKGLTGTLEEFGLEVLLRDGELLLRQEEQEKEWRDAAEFSLESLQYFLLEPANILQRLQGSFAEAVAGQEIDLHGVSCRTVYLPVREWEPLLQELFPSMDTGGVSEVTLAAAMAPQTRLKQLRLLVEFDGQGQDLQKSYFLEY